MNLKKIIALIIGGINFASASCSCFALDVYKDAYDEVEHIIEEVVSEENQSPRDKFEVRFGKINIKEELHNRLSKISKEGHQNLAIKKLADLYAQHVNLEEDKVLPMIKDRYYNEIDNVNSADDALAMLKKLQIDLQVVSPNIGPKFCEELYKNLEDQDEISSDDLDIYFKNFIKETALSEEISGKVFTQEDKDNFKKILCACRNNLETLKQNMKDSIDFFCNEYSGFYGHTGYDCSNGIWENGFTHSVDIAFGRVYDLFEDLCGEHLLKFIGECSTEVKEAVKKMVNESEKFLPESKLKICEAIDKVSVNGSEYQELQSLDGLEELTLADNFIDSVISLRRIQTQKQLMHDYKSIAPYSLKFALNSKLESILMRNSSASIGYDLEEKGFSQGGIEIIMEDLFIWNSISKVPGLANKIGFSQRDLLKFLVEGVMAHEMGHILDKICDTETHFDSIGSEKFCTEEERQKVMSFKHSLMDSVEKKIKGRTSWSNVKGAHGEIFADFVAYNSLYRIAFEQNRDTEQIGSIVSKIFPMAFWNHIYMENGDAGDIHPSDKIRFDSVLGLNDWLYDLGLGETFKDTLFTAPEERVNF